MIVHPKSHVLQKSKSQMLDADNFWRNYGYPMPGSVEWGFGPRGPASGNSNHSKGVGTK